MAIGESSNGAMIFNQSVEYWPNKKRLRLPHVECFHESPQDHQPSPLMIAKDILIVWQIMDQHDDALPSLPGELDAHLG
jgi:hypothetical protein